MEKIKTQKYYAVAQGKKTGIYLTWAECEAHVKGFKGARYKSFKTKKEAQDWLKGSVKKESTQDNSIQLAQIYLYSDGGSRNHGNKKGQHVQATDKAAWAYLIQRAEQNYTGVDGEYGSTNNRMELLGLLNGLQFILKNGWQNEKIYAILDSKYILDALGKGWLRGWQVNGWKKANGQPVANKELWQQLIEVLILFPNLNFSWTKGHANNKGNNYVDKLLNQKMDQM